MSKIEVNGFPLMEVLEACDSIAERLDDDLGTPDTVTLLAHIKCLMEDLPRELDRVDGEAFKCGCRCHVVAARSDEIGEISA